MTRAPALFASLGTLLLGVACADLKTADPAASGDGGASSSSSSGTASGSSSGSTSSGGSSGTGSSSGNPRSGGNGPGPYGALPRGYCCTADSECRDRHCVTIGSQKMCLDACREQTTCEGKGLPTGFTCDGQSGADGWCQPPGGFTCLAASTFVRGTKTTGSCCTATGDGSSGLECEGGSCDWYTEQNLDPPFFCTNRCETGAECGKGFKCQLEIGKCVPANEPFVCE